MRHAFHPDGLADKNVTGSRAGGHNKVISSQIGHLGTFEMPLSAWVSGAASLEGNFKIPSLHALGSSLHAESQQIATGTNSAPPHSTDQKEALPNLAPTLRSATPRMNFISAPGLMIAFFRCHVPLRISLTPKASTLLLHWARGYWWQRHARGGSSSTIDGKRSLGSRKKLSLRSSQTLEISRLRL
jgi:hypothetical protein